MSGWLSFDCDVPGCALPAAHRILYQALPLPDHPGASHVPEDVSRLPPRRLSDVCESHADELTVKGDGDYQLARPETAESCCRDDTGVLLVGHPGPHRRERVVWWAIR